MLNQAHSFNSANIAMILFELELNFHKRNPIKVHECLKRHIETNHFVQKFYSILTLQRHHGLLHGKFSNFDRVHFIQNICRRSLIISTVKMCFKIIAHLILYSWDLIKDVYLLFVYSEFFPLSINSFASFGNQTFLFLLLSILVPNIFNILVLITESSVDLPINGKLLLICFVFVSQSIVGYSINRIQFRKERLQRYCSKSSFEHQQQKMTEGIKVLEQDCFKLNRLQAKLKENENTFESSVQALILLMAIGTILR